MIIEIRRSDGKRCETCGATELVTTSRTADELTRDLRALLHDTTPARWRVFARRAHRRLHAQLDAVVDELKQLTHQA